MQRSIRSTLLMLLAASLGSCGGSDDPNGPDSPTAAVTVSPAELALVIGESQQLTAVPRDAAGNPLSGRSISWTTSQPAVATVSTTGLVQALDVGSATISATAEGKSGESAVSVTFPPVASITVSPGNAAPLLGVSDQWTADVRDAAGMALVGVPVAWSTTEPTVATVSSAGIVTARGEGTATITATAGGKSGSAPVSVSTVIFTSIAAGGAHTCALTATGAAYCWGRAESGQLGVPVPLTTCATDGGPIACIRTAVPVGGGHTFAQLAAGGAHTCGLTGDGTAYCWGNNAGGQLGDNSTPVPVATDLKFASIDGGANHTCGLTGGGIAYCWGDNAHGELGDGTALSSSAPVAVAGNHTFQVIAAGGFSQGHTCAVANDGKAYCWGYNERGQLGNGTAGLGQGVEAPALVSGDHTFVAVTAGLGSHSCGLTGTGAAYCWGANPFGALGDGSTVASPVPVPVSGGIAFAQLTAGGFLGHTCGRTAAGAAYCWGDNEQGQVGDGSTTDRLEPKGVSGIASFTTLDAGFRHTCGFATTGTLYCWGSGGGGQLGINSDAARSVPTKVLGQP